MNIFFIILTFLMSAFIARVLIPRILLISMRKKLFDIPDERKVHTKAIPRLGGVSFFPTTLFSFCLVYAFRLLDGDNISSVYAGYLLPELLLFACGMTLLYLTGIADDLVGVRYRQKFVIQIFCACLFPLSGLWLNDLYGLFGIHELPACVGMPFTVLTVVFITNAINLIDGIDGLASGLSSVALLIFTFLFMEKGLWSYAMLAAGTFGVLVPFFYYNVFGSVERARKIFMGDTGSLTLGYTLSFLAIKYSQVNPDVMDYTEGAFVIAFSTLIIPTFDVVRVVMLRIRKGKSPFEPDKNHIHHKLLAIGLTPRKAMLSLLLMSCAFSAANILLMPYVNNTVMLIADIAIWTGLNLYWDYLRDKK
ncbi:MraY family glycosyltransferase [Bacteroides helcogenes]|uniref:Glycosyl transferase, family 4, conserved region n=1 Tax=Bacteroides helcogenes (strain ATCC 35417 / DSM 20613 / JCM 6297 / CCUG 15421 / P 36-108) TaxID=693979 RepID=E6SPD0_BACT6|nr:MraY family glycosyltransferase [Bacteroides helcogenes]ADV44887.1 Glycosyl transferase, family 4, conserved region [Bacteroides helcogenes P 36-108]MDY5239744.1 MraY family glycosyltransferase [Bacteroides helcogenes]